LEVRWIWVDDHPVPVEVVRESIVPVSAVLYIALVRVVVGVMFRV
jgi:hypothetical protein